jgi:hypothetical protein
MSSCIRKNKSQQSAIPSWEINCYDTLKKTMANGSEWFLEHNYAYFLQWIYMVNHWLPGKSSAEALDCGGGWMKLPTF